MNLDAVLTFAALAFGIYAGYRKMGRAIRATWEHTASSVSQEYRRRIAIAYVKNMIESEHRLDGTGYSVPPDTNAVELPGTAPARNQFPADYTPTEDAAIAFLAGFTFLDKSGAKTQFTANKLADLFGGRRDRVLTLVRETRGGPKPLQDGDLYQIAPGQHRRVFVRNGQAYYVDEKGVEHSIPRDEVTA